jgi:hypothetical protein
MLLIIEKLTMTPPIFIYPASAYDTDKLSFTRDIPQESPRVKNSDSQFADNIGTAHIITGKHKGYLT